jgi:hypothetical protein
LILQRRLVTALLNFKGFNIKESGLNSMLFSFQAKAPFSVLN